MAQPAANLPDNKILTLLEQNKVNAFGDLNGTYSINLKEELILKEGDELQVTKAFIDTTSEGTNFITVEQNDQVDETQITIKTGMYYRDIINNAGDPSGDPATPISKPLFGNWSVSAEDRQDGQPYILQNQSEAYLDTEMTWEVGEQVLVGASPAPVSPDDNFGIQIEAVADPSTNNGFGYNVNPSPTSGATPLLPTLPFNFIKQVNMIGGHCNLDTSSSALVFKFYPSSYTPPAGVPEVNAHSALISRWFETDGKTIKGWKIIANPNTTQTGASAWGYKSDATGYNYFTNNGKPLFRVLDSIIIPVLANWNASANSGTPEKNLALFPSFQLDYTTTTGVATSSFNFTEYPADYVVGPAYNLNAGMDNFLSNVKRYPSNGGGTVTRIAHTDVPKLIRDLGYNREWEFYKWTQYVDKLDPHPDKPTQIVRRIVYDPEKPFIITNVPAGTDYSNNGGFVNLKSTNVAGGSKGGNLLSGPTIDANFFLSDSKPVESPQSSGSVMTPREYTTKITIPPGNYTYDGLAQTLTDAFNTQTSPIVGLSNNPNEKATPYVTNYAGYSSSFLQLSSYDLMMQYDGYNTTDSGVGYPTYPNNYVFSGLVVPERTLPDGTTLAAIDPPQTGTSEGVQPFFLSEDATRLFQYKSSGVFPTSTAAPQLLGAENFSFIFDETSSTFQLIQSHTPIYIDGPASAGVTEPGPITLKQISTASSDNTFLDTFITADTSSGTFITSMEPRSLFFDKMRLPTSIITDIAPHNTSIVNFVDGLDTDFSDASLSSVAVHPLTLRKGREITGYFSGIDSLVSKNSTFNQISVPANMTSEKGYGWDSNIEVSTPVGIEGSPIIITGDDDPFYQIEISGINSQQIIGQHQKNSLIQALVGKYFSAGNFTQSTGDGIVYVHKGEPLTIKSLRVRILNSQGEPELGLGPNTAVVLQLSTNK